MPKGTARASFATALAGLDHDTVDQHALRALIGAMATWDAEQFAMYREAVLEEVAALGGRPVCGFLAAEVLALVTAEDAAVA